MTISSINDAIDNFKTVSAKSTQLYPRLLQIETIHLYYIDFKRT